jgi:glucose/arabinose dehydrogenase
MVFLTDGNANILVAEKSGALSLVKRDDGNVTPVTGVPAVSTDGEGGLLDVVMHANFNDNGLIYLSYVEAGAGGTGVAVASARLNRVGPPTLQNLTVIWRQPKSAGTTNYGGSLWYRATSDHLFIGLGDRGQPATAQDLALTTGKVLRLTAGGGIPNDNPFYNTAGAAREIWTRGHRIPVTLEGPSAQLIELEPGAAGGDEINLIDPVAGRGGGNYGWPLASNGQAADGSNIPDHTPGDGFIAPAISWTPAITPQSLVIYPFNGALFPAWRQDLIVASATTQGLIRVRLTGTTGAEQERIPLGAVVRDLAVGPDGALWVLEAAPSGRLRRLTPVT